MEHNEKVLLMGMTFGIAVVFTFAAIVALAGDRDDCVIKAETAHAACQKELGKVQICEDAYLRTLLTCQINKKENSNGRL